MKKVMFALCLMLGGSVVLVKAQAQDTTSNQYRTEQKDKSAQDQSTAQDSTQDQSSQAVQGQDQPGMMQGQDRERIQSTELPDGVKRSLEGQEYRGWLVNGAFKGKGAASSDQSAVESDSTSNDASQQSGDNNAVGAQGQEIYIVELKNGAETKTIRFDKDGKKLEGMEEGQGMEGQQDQNNQSTPNGQNDQSNQSDKSTQPEQSTQSSDQTSPNQSGAPQEQSKTHDPNKKSDEK